MNSDCPKRFVVIQNIPSPYRLHLFTVLGQELSSRGYGLHVHFMSKGHAERPMAWLNPEISFPHTYWTDYGVGTHHSNPGLVVHLRRCVPADYLLVGSAWDTFTGIASSFVVPRKKGILWTEGNTKTPGKLDGFLGQFKRRVLSRFDYVAVPGQEGVGYVALHQQRTVKQMPVPVLLPNLIDERRFKLDPSASQSGVAELKGRLGVLASERLAICPARLETVKGLAGFLEGLPDKCLDGWKLLIIGEGSQRDAIERIVRARGLTERVILLGYVPYEEMPLFYAASDLFVLPSLYDPNPLSVVEAMHSGLPLLLSKQVGNYPEALIAGKTGWGFSPFDVREMGAAAVQAFSATPGLLREKGREAKRQADLVWGSETAIRNFADALGIA